MPADFSNFQSILSKSFTENGLSKLLTFDTSKKFEMFAKYLLEENEKYNLTAIKEPTKVALLHFVDCALISSSIPKGARVIDVGCGAGFPSLPLAIVRPDLEITCMDSTEKRIHFIEEVVKLLGLTNVKTIVGRAEEIGVKEEYREQFDVATARAVAQLRVLLELCMPFVKVGGCFLAMKGKNVSYEMSDAKKALSLLGGGNFQLDDTPIKSSILGDQDHALVQIDKIRKTPTNYPRVFAQISKKPL